MFAPGALTVGLFLPLWPYSQSMQSMAGQGQIIRAADDSEFAAVWVRDVPLYDPGFRDVGQVFDPWTYLAWLAAQTSRISLAAGSIVFSLRHPIDIAKQSASIDQLSGGRLIIGAASGDRATEYPAYGIDHATRGQRYREAVRWFRALTEENAPCITGHRSTFGGGLDLLPKPAARRVPLLVTGSSQQEPTWIAENADGWLVYPGPADRVGTDELGRKITTWRELVPGQEFRPVVTNEWIDLAENPKTPPTPLRGGFVLHTGTEGLLDLLGRWREAGINHGALGVQHGSRPAVEAVQQLIEEVVPEFPALAGPEPLTTRW
ncbi:LLM class oxidoreductase [Mycobacterium sp. CBMA271]|nr:LLM class oxidoreductase [Mycobacteroides sp. CBMA 271]